MPTLTALGIDRLSVEERLMLVQEIWFSATLAENEAGR